MYKGWLQSFTIFLFRDQKCSHLFFKTPLLLLFFLSSCFNTSLKQNLKKGKQLYKEKQYKEALVFFSKTVRRDPESPHALEASRIAAQIATLNLKDYEKALSFYKHQVAYSKSFRNRMIAQNKIIEILFHNLGDYKNAIIALNKTLEVSLKLDAEFKYRFLLAKSYFYEEKFFQSLTETETLLKKKLNREQIFNIKLFRGNVFFTTKKLDKALDIFLFLIKNFPNLSRKEKVGMSVVVCYEELNEYDKAIEHLEKIKPFYEDARFIDLKIQKLKKRRVNLPGYKGFRK